ncbi:MAG: hypothetical protein WA728_15855 [Xanthobacteraceae bacterium]
MGVHTLGLLERLRSECKDLWGASSALYHRIDGLLREVANPNLQDIPMRLPFRVERIEINCTSDGSSLPRLASQ